MIPCNLLSSSFSDPCLVHRFLLSSNLSTNSAITSLSSPPPTIPARSYLCSCWRRGSSLDPNAESFRGGRFRFRDEPGGGEVGGDLGQGRRRRWWSDRNSENDLEEEFESLDDEDEDGEPLWEKIWIFKVFKSYGYLLPAIIASMLLATGPKAFLMALALPLGQSAISLAVDKLWGSRPEEPSPRPRMRRKPFSKTSAEFRKQEQDETSDEYRHQSRAASDADSNDGEVAGSEPTSFGGWDELDQQRAQSRWRTARSERSTQSSKMKTGKLSKGRYGEAPLFLRLLIAVFPFLGSWIRIL